MAFPSRPESRRDFKFAIICTLPHEAELIKSILDVQWDTHEPPHAHALRDQNTYVTGAIARHRIVLAYPAKERMRSGIVARDCSRVFEGIQLSFVIGTCGIIPFGPEFGVERVLGDVVISHTLVESDLRMEPLGEYVVRDYLDYDNLGRPLIENPEVRDFIVRLEDLEPRERLNRRMRRHLRGLQGRPLMNCRYPGKALDRLHSATYAHKNRHKTCDQLGCRGKLLPRQRMIVEESQPPPVVTLGQISSGHLSIGSGEDRDGIASHQGAIAFELKEAAPWRGWPSVVIKGASDYADGHSNEKWLNYAGATAVACLRAVMEQLVLQGETGAQEVTDQTPDDDHADERLHISLFGEIDQKFDFDGAFAWEERPEEARAEAELQEVGEMERARREMGWTHQETLRITNNLISMYQTAGKWPRAEALCLQLHSAMREKLGENHKVTLSALDSLVLTYHGQKRWREAEKLAHSLSVKKRDLLGENDRDALRSAHLLAVTYMGQERWGLAEPLVEWVWEKRSLNLGDDDPETLDSLRNMETTYRKLNNNFEADIVVDQLQWLEVRKRPAHPHLLLPTRMSDADFVAGWKRA